VLTIRMRDRCRQSIDPDGRWGREDKPKGRILAEELDRPLMEQTHQAPRTDLQSRFVVESLRTNQRLIVPDK